MSRELPCQKSSTEDSSSSVMITTANGQVTAEPLVLDLILPCSNQRMTVKIDPFSTFADLKLMIRTVLGDMQESAHRVVLSRRVSLMRGWERVLLEDQETLIGKLGNRATYRIDIETSSPTSATSASHEFSPVAAYGSYQQPSWMQYAYSPSLKNRHIVENRDDELLAMSLQTEECRAHHEKIEQDKATCPDKPRAVTPPPSKKEETMESFGELILRGTLSQYSAGGGQSACTSIALVGASHLLLFHMNSGKDILDSISPEILDMVIRTGIRKHSMAVSGHSNLEDLWSLPIYEDTVESLKRGQRIEDRVGFEGFNRALERSWELAHRSSEQGAGAVAVVITKPPETILCFSGKAEEWYLLDSHGENHVTDKVAYVMQFKSTMALALALESKFPSLLGAEQDLTVAMYNSFEATPITATQETKQIEAQTNSAAVQVSLSDPQAKPAATPKESALPDQGSNTAQSSLRASSPPPAPQPKADPLLDLEMFQCPYTLVIMADPVVCDDGHTYERASIEAHFQARRDEEERRLRALRGEEKEVDDSTPTCCRGPRPMIQLTSPMTGVAVSDRLVPNHFVERQIVALVESNALDMTEAELLEWQERRRKKREKDRQRVKEDQRIREEQEEMQRNREEAQRLREEEAAVGCDESDLPRTKASGTSSQLVRVDRYRGQKLAADDLGISVSLCDKSSWVELEYVRSASQLNELRCMLPCCARLLPQDETNWCMRCGRVACSACLSFQVTDITAVNTSELHRICGECVLQVLDTMPRDGAIGQARAYLAKLRLQPYMDELSARAVDAQDIQARHAAEESFRPDIRKLGQDIQELRDLHTRLQAQFEEAESRANEARHDDGATAICELDRTVNEEVAEWEETVADLQTQYDALLGKSAEDMDDEDAQVAHIQAVSDITARLDSALISLAQAQSRVAGYKVASESFPTGKGEDGEQTSSLGGLTLPLETDVNMSVADLQRTCETLRRIHDELQSRPAANDVEAATSHMEAISTVMSRFDQAQAHLMEARSRLDADPRISFITLEHLSDLISRFVNQARTAGRQVMAKNKPTKGINRSLRRIFSTPVTQNSPTASLDPEIMSTRLEALLDASQACLNANSLERRLTCVNTVLEGLDQLTDNIEHMNKQAQGLHREAVQGAMTLNKEITCARNAQRDEEQQVRQAASKVPGSQREIASMSLDELLSEFQQLGCAIEDMTDTDEITAAVMRQTEIEQVIDAAQTVFIQQDVSAENELHEAADPGLLDAIGTFDEDWPLPLGLKYPTTRMQNQLELLQNTLADNLVKSERTYDNEFSDRRRRMTEEKEQLEDQIQALRARVENAQASAEAEQQRLEQRRERRRQEEAEVRERERQRLEEERRVRRKREELERKNAADEARTMEALRNAVGQDDNASAFGGRGDLRMCKICKAGPVENMACSNLKTHNDSSSTYKGSTVAGTTNPNHCKHCGWYDDHWHNWPIWDGVFGPH